MKAMPPSAPASAIASHCPSHRCGRARRPSLPSLPSRLSLVWLSLLSTLAAVGMVASMAGMARASVMLALDLPELVRQAEHIAVVEVGPVQAAWDARHERIFSTIDLKVIESWKSANGPAPAPETHLTVVQPGGTVGDITMTVTGLGTFVPGERSLVFLRGPSARAQVVGMTQGKRSIRYEAASRRWLVAPPDLHQAKLVRPASPALSTPGQAVKAGQAASGLQASPQQAAKATTPPLTAAPATTSAATTVSSAMATGAPASRVLPLDDLRAEVKRLIGAAGPR